MPALKVQFPLWHKAAIEGDGDRIVPLAEFEIEMLKSKQGGKRMIEIHSFLRSPDTNVWSGTRDGTVPVVSLEAVFYFLSVTFAAFRLFTTFVLWQLFF